MRDSESGCLISPVEFLMAGWPACTSGHFVLVWGVSNGRGPLLGYFPGFKGLLLPLTLSYLHGLMVLYDC